MWADLEIDEGKCEHPCQVEDWNMGGHWTGSTTENLCSDFSYVIMFYQFEIISLSAAYNKIKLEN